MSKNPDKLTDEILIQMICGQTIDRDKAFQYIFVQSGWRNEAMNRLQKEGVPLQNEYYKRCDDAQNGARLSKKIRRID